MNHKIAIKVGDKWKTVGNVKPNKWNNLSLSLVMGPELREKLNVEDGKWVNLSLFEDKPKQVDDSALADEIPW